ncbi:hypothetical protein RCJ22_33995 [Vibrio sp. FNV 38]|nr:hypothetical protein [Vibrio sp. FNV 38]
MRTNYLGVSVFVASFLLLISGFAFVADIVGLTELRSGILQQWLMMLMVLMIPWSQNHIEGHIAFVFGSFSAIASLVYLSFLLKYFNIKPDSGYLLAVISWFGVSTFAFAATLIAKMVDSHFTFFDQGILTTHNEP